MAKLGIGQLLELTKLAAEFGPIIAELGDIVNELKDYDDPLDEDQTSEVEDLQRHIFAAQDAIREGLSDGNSLLTRFRELKSQKGKK